ncbi:Flp pilus assembly protein CpaB [Dehalobacter sp. DCM]|uniref:Flp pilus assembly protein CpaB n=1 Tax=Dehalobacter sp. DCM TaxID=2907827 RepID=UPI0030818338|nr:Flp pilus assembly protein CpaB [Dehalobacter sp. DCM]
MKKLIILALLLAVITGMAGFLFLSNLEKKVEKNALGGTTPVVVAKVQIPERTKITPEMVEVKNMPTEAVNPLAVKDGNSIVGRVTKVTVESQEQLLTSKLVGEADRDVELAYAVKEGYRALSIRTDDIDGVSGFLVKGDRVDLIMTIDLRIQSKNETVTTATMVAENLEVLEIGLKQSPEDGSQLYTAVTLAVPAKDVLKVNYGITKGDYQLVLRSAADKTIVNPPDIVYYYKE